MKWWCNDEVQAACGILLFTVKIIKFWLATENSNWNYFFNNWSTQEKEPKENLLFLLAQRWNVFFFPFFWGRREMVGIYMRNRKYVYVSCQRHKNNFLVNKTTIKILWLNVIICMIIHIHTRQQTEAMNPSKRTRRNEACMYHIF